MTNSMNFRAVWNDLKRFESNGVSVLVRKSNHTRPRYSCKVQFERPIDRSWIDYRNVRWQGQGRISLEAPIASILEDVMADAEEFIEMSIQEDEDRLLAEREARELAQLERNKPRPTGGTHRPPTEGT